jgi:hypothetical protein
VRGLLQRRIRAAKIMKKVTERDEKERMGSTYLFEGFMVSMHNAELFFCVLFFFLFVAMGTVSVVL